MIENYKQAATAYRDTYVSNMSNFDIVVELYKGILKNVRQAKSAYQADKLDEMCGFVEKANRILIALQSHLDFDNGGEASVFLNNFYNGIFSSLSSVQLKNHVYRGAGGIYTPIEKYSETSVKTFSLKC